MVSTVQKLGKALAIIVGVWDDVGWGDGSFYDIPTPHPICTPKIDKLARSGVILDSLLSFPVCTPSRSAILSSKYPSDFGLQHLMLLRYDNHSFPGNVPIWPEAFKEESIDTSLFGKYHLGAKYMADLPHNRGFDYTAGYLGSSLGYYDHVELGGRDFFVNGKAMFDNSDYDIYMDDLVIDHLDHWLDSTDNETQKFIYVGFQCCHQPMELPPIVLNYTCGVESDEIDPGARLVFNQMISYLDHSVDRTMQVLSKHGITVDNSVFAFVGDNNGHSSFGSLPYWRGNKGDVTAGGTRVPGFIFGRDIKPQYHTKHVSLVDLIPTLTDFANWDITLPDVRGISRRPSINEGGHYVDLELEDGILVQLDWCYDTCLFDWTCSQPCKCPEKPTHFPNDKTVVGFVVGNWKIIYFGLNAELYNLKDDPMESINLKDKHPNIVKLLTKRVKVYYDDAHEILTQPCDPTIEPVDGWWIPYDHM